MILSLRFIIKLFIKTFIGNFHPVILWRFWFHVIYYQFCFIFIHLLFVAGGIFGHQFWVRWFDPRPAWLIGEVVPPASDPDGFPESESQQEQQQKGREMCWESIQKMFQYICSLVIVDIRYTYIFICYYMYLFFWYSHIPHLFVIWEMLPLFSNQVWHKQGICPLQCYPKACETFWLQLNLIWFLQRGSTTIENSWDKKHFKHFSHTPSKFNIAPGKWWLEDYISFGMAFLQGLCLNFQGVTLSCWKENHPLLSQRYCSWFRTQSFPWGQRLRQNHTHDLEKDPWYWLKLM